jgi:hypothetical protein
MTEVEWRTCTDPERMLEFIWSRVSERKRRLFVCACCRYFWELLPQKSRQAIEVAERCVEGLASDAERADLLEAAHQAVEDMVAEQRFQEAALATQARYALLGPGPFASGVTRWETLSHEVYFPDGHGNPVRPGLVREVFNPFQPVAVDLGWLTGNGARVRQVAEAIYQEGRFTDLPILADALEEAGCTEHAILSHCHQASEHVRGCWVLDLILSKDR